jgi:hypothetical protein
MGNITEGGAERRRKVMKRRLKVMRREGIR